MRILSHPPEDTADGSDQNASCGSDGNQPNDGDHDNGKRLVSHGKGCFERASIALGELEDHLQNGDGGMGVDTVRAVTTLHDIAKATPAFQQYLRSDGPQPSPHDHSPFGAIVTAAVLDLLDKDGRTVIGGFLAVARHHGGLVNNPPAAYIENEFLENENRKGEIARIASAIEGNPTSLEAADELILFATDGVYGWDDVRERILGGDDEYGWFKSTYYHTRAGIQTKPDRSTFDASLYSLFLRLWGALVLADKTDAAGLPQEAAEYDPPSLDTATLSAKIDSKGDGTQLDTLREMARKDVQQTVAALVSEQNGTGEQRECDKSDERGNEGRYEEGIAPGTLPDVMSITLPTGLGKTLTGSEAAFTINDALGEAAGPIVYALPYTSVVEQTVDELQNIFDIEPCGEALTVHQHLADTVSPCPDGWDVETEDHARTARMLGESWDATAIVTTFVQLFESIINPTNSQALKLSNLRNATIVLDEPQTLPDSDWQLFRDVVRILVDDFGCQIITMTATQPHIFTRDDRFDAVELVSNPDDYQTVDTVQRVEYVLDSSMPTGSDTESAPTTDQALATTDPVDHSTAAQRIITETGVGEASMVICNTVSSARELGSLVRDTANISLNAIYDDCIDETVPSAETVVESVEAAIEASDADGTPLVVAHLTARHRPIDRRRILTTLSKLDPEDATVVFVTTQIVEAGVDISFDRVYRDFAPLPNIVQAAGRCNRNFERDRGVVTIWRLGRPDSSNGGAIPCHTIYDGAVEPLDITAGVLRDIATPDTMCSNPPHDPLSVTPSVSPCEDGGHPLLATISSAVMHEHGVKRYYDSIVRRGVGQTETSAIARADMGRLSDYSLVSDGHRTIDVIVCRSEADEDAVERLRECSTTDQRQLLDSLATIRVSVTVYGDSPLAQLPTITDGSDIRILRPQQTLFNPLMGVVGT